MKTVILDDWEYATNSAAVQLDRLKRFSDLFAREPVDPHDPLLQLDNVILTPHIGWKTDETFESFLNGSIENIESFFQRTQLVNIANSQVIASPGSSE